MDKFNIDERTLEGQLFSPEAPKIGVITSLNVNYLPHLSAAILRRLPRREQCCLIEFELQTYILELALYQLKVKTLKDLIQTIIRDIRMTTKFWIPSSEAWNEVQLRLKLYHLLVPKCTEQPEQRKAGGKRSLPEVLQDSTQLRKYISQIDFAKLDYKSEFLRIPEVFNIIIEYDQENSQNKQLFAIEQYSDQTNALQYIIQQKYEYVQTPQVEQKAQQVDLLSRVNQVQRETRVSQQMSYRDIRMILKEQQKLDMEEKRTIFVPNAVVKYQKIDIVILPFIYTFIFKNAEFNRNHLRIQNLILFLVLSDQEVYKSNKQKKNIFNDSGDHKTAQKQFQKYIETSNDKIMISFNEYCTSQGICLSYYFSSTPSNYKKELILIRNILILAMKFAQILLNVPYMFEQQELAEFEIDDDNADKSFRQTDYSNDYVYFQILTQLEYYYQIPQDKYDKLIQVYENYYEVVMTSKKDHFKEYFGLLRQRKQVFGLRSSMEQVETAIELYNKYINAPKTQEKRSYIYHSEQRTEWTEEQYKLFLDGLMKNFDTVVNNKRIAKHMGDVNPNHVRFIKGVYLRQLKKRAREKNIPRKDLLQLDIDNFDIQLFDKVRKQ